MQFLTDFADQGSILPVVLASLLGFVLIRWRRGALAWAGVLGATLALVLCLKLGLRACGAPAAWLPTNPSGHVASGTAVYGGLAALALHGRRVALLPALLVALAIAATRVGLGVHTVGDVLSGGAIGLVAAAAVAWFAGPPPREVRGLPVLLALTGAALLHGAHLDAEGSIRRLAARLRPTIAACAAPTALAVGTR